jgi:hypothetical protein
MSQSDGFIPIDRMRVRAYTSDNGKSVTDCHCSISFKTKL